MLDKDYKFLSVESLSQISSRTQLLCKKYFNQYWNLGGRESAFMKAKKKMENVRLKFFASFLSTSLSFCSSLRRKLLLMRRSRGNRTSVKKRVLEMMMLAIIHFSCLRS